MRDAHEILGELVQADVAAGSPEIFVLSYIMEGPEIIGHPGWSEEVAAPTFIDIDELADRGWLRITQSRARRANLR